MNTVFTPPSQPSPPSESGTSPGAPSGASQGGEAGEHPSASFWARLGSACFRHRWRVLGAWVVVLVAVFVAVGVVGTSSDSSFEIPNSDSQDGFAILEEHFEGSGSFLSGSIVFRAEQGVDDPAVVAAMTAMFDEVGDIEGVSVTSPFSERGSAQGLVAPDGLTAYAQVDLAENIDEVESSEIGQELLDARPELDGLQVEIGGRAFAEFEPPEAELIGLAFAIVILIVSFGSVLAMGLPIGVALFGVGIGVGLITLLTNVMAIPDFATTLGAMIGLGVGIDYALFIVTRYREGIRAGMSPHRATVVAIDTAGRAVMFAGFTVVISLLGMYIMGLAFINGLATGAAVTVAVTMLASITLLPALIAIAGPRVEITRWRGLVAAGLVAIALLGVGIGVQPLLVGAPLAAVVLIASFVVAPLRREVPPRRPVPLRDTWSYRWSRFVQRNPWPTAIGVAAFLLLLTVPVLGLRLGFADESNFAEDTTTRQAYELIADGFGPGTNGPLVLAAEISGPQDLQVGQDLVGALQATDGVAQAVGPIPSDLDDPASSEAFIIRVTPETGPQDEATADLVRTLRNDVLPAALDGTGLDVNVSGSVAANVDFSSYLAERIPYFFAAVLGLSFLLLMMVFRSLLVPLKAVVMNMLSIGGAYGVVVAIFQWGWGVELLGTSNGPIEPFLPMMLFAIVFGLSMDYEVFLLSRVKEEYDKTGDAMNSVADGLAATARVITAAAAIMVVVFGSFVLEDDRIIKMFGVGLATAVFLDASLVRMLLVPATMELLGERNWWLPRWLDRILPRLNVEGAAHHDEPDAAIEPTRPDSGERELVGTGPGD